MNRVVKVHGSFSYKALLEVVGNSCAAASSIKFASASTKTASRNDYVFCVQSVYKGRHNEEMGYGCGLAYFPKPLNNLRQNCK
jgi:hypothetical protein